MAQPSVMVITALVASAMVAVVVGDVSAVRDTAASKVEQRRLSQNVHPAHLAHAYDYDNYDDDWREDWMDDDDDDDYAPTAGPPPRRPSTAAPPPPRPTTKAPATPSPRPTRRPWPTTMAPATPSPRPTRRPWPTTMAPATPSPRPTRRPWPTTMAPATPSPRPTRSPWPTTMAPATPSPRPTSRPIPTTMAPPTPAPAPASKDNSAFLGLADDLTPVGFSELVFHAPKLFHTTRHSVKWSNENFQIAAIQITDLLKDGSNAQFDLVRGEPGFSELQIDFESARGGTIAYSVTVWVWPASRQGRQSSDVYQKLVQ